MEGLFREGRRRRLPGRLGRSRALPGESNGVEPLVDQRGPREGPLLNPWQQDRSESEYFSLYIDSASCVLCPFLFSRPSGLQESFASCFLDLNPSSTAPLSRQEELPLRCIDSHPGGRIDSQLGMHSLRARSKVMSRVLRHVPVLIALRSVSVQPLEAVYLRSIFVDFIQGS